MKTKSTITTIELTHEELLTALHSVIPNLSSKAKIEDYENGITFSFKVEREEELSHEEIDRIFGGLNAS